MVSGRVLRVEADPGRCCSAGMCALTVPAVFDQSDADGTVVVLDAQPADRHHAALRDAVRSCPSGAIRLSTRDASGQMVAGE
ncbi:4Fe-4S domain-containing protein [Streptomyces marokkonensis]|uniref:4Fe-4S domain-containing protein n=1 Tax=Streptomyces marokkonensis TaxID=324855 RepID=UPI0011F11D38